MPCRTERFEQRRRHYVRANQRSLIGVPCSLFKRDFVLETAPRFSCLNSGIGVGWGKRQRAISKLEEVVVLEVTHGLRQVRARGGSPYLFA